MAEWGAGLKREHRENAEGAVAEARQVLVDFGLVRVEPDGGWLVHAVAARYAVSATLAEPVGDGQPSLFEEDA
jgi:hypothetical protein